MREKMFSEKAKRHFEVLLKQRMDHLLQLMYASPSELMDLESGEEFICSLCDMDFKRCEVEPDYRCEKARKAETEFKEAELALTRLEKGTYGFCINCLAFIGNDELEKSPTRMLCDKCAQAT